MGVSVPGAWIVKDPAFVPFSVLTRAKVMHCSLGLLTLPTCQGTSGSPQARGGPLAHIPSEVREIHIRASGKSCCSWEGDTALPTQQTCAVHAGPPVCLLCPSFFPLLPLSYFRPSRPIWWTAPKMNHLEASHTLVGRASCSCPWRSHQHFTDTSGAIYYPAF